MYTIIGGDGKEYGPVPAQQVRAWIAAGRANLETQAKLAGTDEWKRVGDFPELSGEAPPLLPEEAPTGGEAELAGRGARLGAWFVDWLLSFLATLPAFAAIGKIPQGTWTATLNSGDWQQLSGLLPQLLPGFRAAAVALVFLAFVQIWMLSSRGQSIGKRMFSIRIVLFRDGAHAGFVHAWLVREFVRGILCAIPYLGMVFWFVDACFIFGDQRRCLHDLMSGTKVVRA